MKFEKRNEAETASNSAQGEERRQFITENRQGMLQPDPHSEKKVAVSLLQTDGPAGFQAKKDLDDIKTAKQRPRCKGI